MSPSARRLLFAVLAVPPACGPSGHTPNPVVLDGSPEIASDVSADVTSDVADDHVDAGVVAWSRRYGGTGREVPFGLGVSSTGLTFVGAMTTSPSIDFGDGARSCTGSCLALAAIESDGTIVWSKVLARDGAISATTMSLDVTSSLVVGGSLFATTDFGGTPLVAPGCTSAASPDAFVVRFDGDGYYLFARRFGDCDYQTVTATRTYGTRILVAGTFQSTIDLGLGPLVAVGARDLFLAEFDGGGKTLWSKRFGAAGSTSTSNAIRSIAIDEATENVIVTGDFEGTLDLGGGPLTAVGGTDVLVARFDDAGEHVWSRRLGDADDQRAVELAIDAAGDVALTGTTKEGISVTKLAGDGAPVWSKVFAASDARTSGLHLGRDARIFLTGEFSGSFDLGAGPLRAGGEGRRSLFAAALTPAGDVEWSLGLGSPTGDSRGIAIDVDPWGAPVLFGAFDGTVDVGRELGGAILTELGSGDLLLGKLAP
jgi:hypothetical protein